MTPLPALPGSLIGVQVLWTGAPDGNARIELQWRTTPPAASRGSSRPR
jgi:hypothetical protein